MRPIEDQLVVRHNGQPAIRQECQTLRASEAVKEPRVPCIAHNLIRNPPCGTVALTHEHERDDQ